jgi:hypothetical protein
MLNPGKKSEWADNRLYLAGRPRLEAALAAAPDLYELVATRTGGVTPLRRADGKALFSRYDPRREAERWLATQSLRPDDLPVFIGFNPHLIAACGERPLVVVEEDAALLRALMDGPPLDMLDADVHLVLDPDGPLLANAIRASFDLFRHLEVRVLRVPHVENDAWVLAMTSTALEIQREVSLNALTIASQSQAWMKAVAENLVAWTESPESGAIIDRLEGETAILVAAGPSLEKNGHLLAEVRDRALVIAVDTALRRLDRLGIVPDIVVGIDTNEVNAWDVNDVGAAALQSLLAADPVAHPKLVRAFRGPKLFLRTINCVLDDEGGLLPDPLPIDLFLERIAGAPFSVSWQSGGSVSTNALFLAFILGIRRVIMIGQDLAFTGDRLHARGVAHEDAWITALDRFRSREGMERRARRDSFEVPAWGGGLVRTSPVLREYLLWIERSIERGFARSMEIIDATEGGAAKRGTRRIAFQEALALLEEGRHPRTRLLEALSRAPRAARAGWRERAEDFARLARACAAAPERVEKELPLARWISLTAELGSRGMAPAARAELLRAAHTAAARYIATLLEKALASLD